MKKIEIKRRGVNARRPFRKLNSVSELVGKEVEVTDDSTLIETEVEEVSIDKNQDVTLTMANGDEVVIDKEEAEELTESGKVEVEPEAEPAAEDFSVTREVEDSEGNVSEVTTKVEASSEGDAIKSVELLDSRRGKNARSYRARKVNSDVEPEAPAAPAEPEKPAEPETPAAPQEPETPAEPEVKEFKIVRVADCDGKKVRKTASVTAPTVDEAIEAVKAKDGKDGIQAEGYEELVDLEPTSTVIINSDVDEDILEQPETPAEPQEPAAPAEPEVPAEPVRSELNAKVCQCPETKKWYIEGDESKTLYETEAEADEAQKKMNSEPENPDVDRESNSFKGVSDFVKRKYGIKL